ncbi:MAG: sel1 repeat family protein [Muribaculaceae bacterium]|nr:sel1 repeat family protein [Muribaculaceae bacterium]
MKQLSLCLALIALLFLSGVGYAQDYVSRKKKEETEQPRPSNPGAKQKQSTKQQRNEYLSPFEMNELGVDAFNDNDYTEALRWFRKSAEQGNASAQYNLGYMYDNGYGVAQNDTEAAKWYSKAAEQGNASAQYNLGYMYDNGYGVAKNDTEAAKWYSKAAEQGDSGAQYYIGTMYQNGYGVAQNYTEAVKWYRKAAEQGNSYA